MGGVDRFVTRKDGKPSSNAFEDIVHDSNHVLTGDLRQANDLRVRVPTTRLEAKPQSNVSSLTALAKALAARHPLRSDSDPEFVSVLSQRHNITDLEQQKSKFDDTELEDSTISSIEGPPQEQLYVMSTGYNQSSPALIKAADAAHYEQQYGEIDDDDGDHVIAKIEGNYDHHRNDMYFQNAAPMEYGSTFYDELAEARKDSLDNIRYFEAKSPSLQKLLPQPVALRPTSPMTFRDRPTSRPRSSQKRDANMPPPPPAAANKPKKSTVVIPPITTTHTTTFDKTSSYTDSSANTTSPPPTSSKDNNKKKRPISDHLDYDIANLKSMTFTHLDNQPFDVDPHRLSGAFVNPESHNQKLHTLKSLSDAERSKFFSLQSKDQWEASTVFFETRLAELFKELRVAREKRRDVAMKFEGEVRERMEAVQGSEGEIERCLGEMRGRARGVLPGGR